jgi:hypothetical protein
MINFGQATLDKIKSFRNGIASGSRKAFIESVECIDWDSLKSSEPIKEAIDLALEYGFQAIAVKLAFQGRQLFPEDADLQKIAEILAPPKVIRTNIPPSEGLQESMKWLKENRSQYQGQWVALQDGIVLGQAESREQLSKTLGDVDPSKAIITKIP